MSVTSRLILAPGTAFARAVAASAANTTRRRRSSSTAMPLERAASGVFSWSAEPSMIATGRWRKARVSASNTGREGLATAAW